MEKRKVVFVAHTPFSLLMAIIIAIVKYGECERVLLSANEIISDNRILESGVFSRIHHIDSTVKSIEGIEKQVDSFLEKEKNISELFVCVFSDRFSTLLVHKLHRKAEINIYPEGSSNAFLDRKIKIVFSDALGKYEYIRKFYEKYPIDFSYYNRTWIIDEKIEQGEIKATREIIPFKQISDELLLKLNYIFNLDDSLLYDCSYYYLDDGCIYKHRLDALRNGDIMVCLSEILGARKMIVKPHPAQRSDYLRNYFKGENFVFWDNVDVPWELVILNINKRKNDKITIITQFPDTALLSSMYIKGDYILECISLMKLLEDYIADYTRKMININIAAYESAREYRDDIIWHEPDNIIDFYKIFHQEPGKKQKISENKLFKQVGNLITDTYLVINGKCFPGQIVFYDEMVSTDFYITCSDEIKSIDWIPSKEKLFASINGLSIKAIMEDETYVMLEKDKNLIVPRDGIIRLDSKCCGKLQKLVFSFGYCVREPFVLYAKKYENAVMVRDFYEKWFDICEENLIKKYIIYNNIKTFYIDGNNKISEIIKESVEKCGVQIVNNPNQADVEVFIDDMKLLLANRQKALALNQFLDLLMEVKSENSIDSMGDI